MQDKSRERSTYKKLKSIRKKSRFESKEDGSSKWEKYKTKELKSLISVNTKVNTNLKIVTQKTDVTIQNCNVIKDTIILTLFCNLLSCNLFSLRLVTMQVRKNYAIKRRTFLN